MPIGPNGERLPYPGEPGGAMVPFTGAPESFGPGGLPNLGAGVGPVPDAQMMANPTDPSAPVGMEAMPSIGTPTSVADALGAALQQTMMQVQEQQGAEMQAILMQNLTEARDMIETMMAVIGAEAATLDGPGAIPGDAQSASIGPPTEFEETGETAVAPPPGLAGSAIPPEANEGMPMGAPAGLPPQMLEELLARGA